MQQSVYTQYRGSQIARIPNAPGLYAWYYKPLVIDDRMISRTLASFLEAPGEISTEIRMRYGVYMESKSRLDVAYGSQRKSATGVLEDAIGVAGRFFSDFFRSNELQLFTRPIYIGIAKNLRNRVYDQHYMALDEMWDVNSSINKYLTAVPDTTVQAIIDKFNLQHTFALEARVRGIATRDLIVHVFTTESLPEDIGPDTDDPELDTNSRRALERIFQLVADPICGRR